MSVHLLLNLITISLLTACSTTPKTFSNVQMGTWEARALIKDKEKAKKYILNIDFVAEKPNHLRMEITSTIAQHLASFALNEKYATYILPKTKLFYKGAGTGNSMKSVLGHSFDPHLINNILFDEPMANKDWSCTNDSGGAVVDCKNTREGLTIEWTEREGQTRKVFVKHSKFEIQLQFHRYAPMDSTDPKLFEITKPNGFKQI